MAIALRPQICDVTSRYVYQSMNCLNAPRISYSSVTGSFTMTITNLLHGRRIFTQAQLPQNVLCQMKSFQLLHNWQNYTKQLHFRRPALGAWLWRSLQCHRNGHYSIGHIQHFLLVRWRGGVTVRHLGLWSVGHGFKSCSRQHCVTTLGKLFTPMCLCHQAV